MTDLVDVNASNDSMLMFRTFGLNALSWHLIDVVVYLEQQSADL